MTVQLPDIKNLREKSYDIKEYRPQQFLRHCKCRFKNDMFHMNTGVPLTVKKWRCGIYEKPLPFTIAGTLLTDVHRFLRDYMYIYIYVPTLSLDRFRTTLTRWVIQECTGESIPSCFKNYTIIVTILFQWVEQQRDSRDLERRFACRFDDGRYRIIVLILRGKQLA